MTMIRNTEEDYEVDDRVHKIRDYINQPRRQYTLFKNRGLWLQLCSSLDVIQDTQAAIDVFPEFKADDRFGVSYLFVYGILQTLFLQQDAVFHLCESLGIPEDIRSYPELIEIREIRNISVGHPTKKSDRNSKRQRDKKISYHFISRPTLTPAGFTLLSHPPEKRVEIRHISIPKIVSSQSLILSQILDKVISHLELEDTKHKEQFRMEKLADSFSQTLGYHFEKVFETIRKGPYEFGKINLEMITRDLERFKDALAKRGIEIDSYDSIHYIYDELDYPLGELRAFYDDQIGRREPRINANTAKIFAYYVRKQIDDLQVIANEIDEDYAS